MRVADYDEFEYDYSTYWKNRNYEHFAEVIALRKLFDDKKGKFFLDIGGSFGRHTQTYYKHFSYPIIVDYSLNTLINNKDRLKEKYENLVLIAANAYHLPFKESSIDSAMMVRVLHHIDSLDKYFSEIQRVMVNNGEYIQEFPNKVHIKAVIRHLVKGNLKFFSKKSFQQPTKNSFEGSKEGKETTFLNFHPTQIKKTLSNYGFIIQRSIGASFFRLEIIKKIVPLKLLLGLESFAQNVLSALNISPSILLDCKMQKLGMRNIKYEALKDIIVCPKCKSALVFKREEAICNSCDHKYEKVAGIWDFRVQ